MRENLREPRRNYALLVVETQQQYSKPGTEYLGEGGLCALMSKVSLLLTTIVQVYVVFNRGI